MCLTVYKGIERQENMKHIPGTTEFYLQKMLAKLERMNKLLEDFMGDTVIFELDRLPDPDAALDYDRTPDLTLLDPLEDPLDEDL